MDPRDMEDSLVARCVAIARGDDAGTARDRREAGVFRLAAMVLGDGRRAGSALLLQAGEAYFRAHPGRRPSVPEIVRNGWIAGVPRFRDMLHHELSHGGRQDVAIQTPVPH